MLTLIKRYKWLVVLGLAAVTGVAVWFFMFRKASEVIILETEKVQYGSISNSVTATGTIEPVDTVAVGCQVSGTIKRIYVDFNSPVKKGQLLAQMDKSLMEAQVQQYSAALEEAKTNLVYQQSNYERQNTLYTAGVISKADFETAVYQYNSAKDNVNVNEAQLKTAQKNLTFTDIYSPITGTVLARSVSEGQTVAASLSTPMLFSIAKDLTKMEVLASVDEADIGYVKQGQRVIFSVDAFPSDTFSGSVKEIRLRSSVSANVVTYLTIIDAPNNNMKLKPGMTANITIYTIEIKHTLLIPSAAIAFAPDSTLMGKYHIISDSSTGSPPIGSHHKNKTQRLADSGEIKINKGYVWLKKDSVTIVSRTVTTGLDDKTMVQVISGLQEGDEVITSYKKLNAKEASSKTTKSPFIPARGGRPPR